MGRVIAIGDVHGCFVELQELLHKLELRPDDWLVFLGDLVDRGPFPVETVRFIMRLRSVYKTTVLYANHEDKLVLWRHREAQRLATGRENKMRRPDPVRQAQWEEFDEGEILWMKNLPPFVRLPDDWVAVHAGFLPGIPLNDQEISKIIRLRTVWPETGEIAQRTDESSALEDPPGSVFWTSMWDGPESVVYGHSVAKGHGFPFDVARDYPRVDHGHGLDGDFRTCLGIDTGCCFGGRLTAAILGRNGSSQIVQVQARAEYAKYGETH